MNDDDRKAKTNPRNDNFHKKEFKELWERINHKAVYTVHFDSDELIDKAIPQLNEKLRVEKLQFTVERGEQTDNASYEQVRSGNSFKITEKENENYQQSVHSAVKYDLIGKIAEGTKLTRSTIANILKGIGNHVFAQFKHNPEGFITSAYYLSQ